MTTRRLCNPVIRVNVLIVFSGFIKLPFSSCCVGNSETNWLLHGTLVPDRVYDIAFLQATVNFAMGKLDHDSHSLLKGLDCEWSLT
jgi:hypothetical protein